MPREGSGFFCMQNNSKEYLFHDLQNDDFKGPARSKNENLYFLAPAQRNWIQKLSIMRCMSNLQLDQWFFAYAYVRYDNQRYLKTGSGQKHRIRLRNPEGMYE